MSDDILKRLRYWQQDHAAIPHTAAMCKKAADEIERLQRCWAEQAEVNELRLREIEARGSELTRLWQEIERLRAEVAEREAVAGYCLKMAFSSWPGLWATLKRFAWLKPVDHLDMKA